MACGIYAITPQWTDEERLLRVTRTLLAGGVGCLQYRDKLRDFNERVRLGRSLLTLCNAARVPFVVNDSTRLALEIKARRVHLGREDDTIDEARAAGMIGIGVSCYNDPERALKATAMGADQVAFGSFFPSRTKPAAVRADVRLVGAFKQRVASTKMPAVIAIGGITAENARALVAAGVDWLAVSDFLYAARDPMQSLCDLIRVATTTPDEEHHAR